MFVKLNKKNYLIAISVILILAVAGATYFKLIYLPAQISPATNVPSQYNQTAPVQQGDISIYARGSGVLVALNQVKLGFGTSGSISEINVKVGDKISQGDVLAVQSDREQFAAAVAADQLTVLTASQALEKLHAEATIIAAQNQTGLASAELALQKAVFNWRNEVFYVYLLSGKKVKAPANYYQTVSPEFFVSAVSEMQTAWYRLAGARSAFTRYSYYPEDNQTRIQAVKNLSDSQQKFIAAIHHLLNVYPPDIQQTQIDIALSTAAARVVQVNQTWDHVNNGPDPDKVALAEQTLTSAEANLAVSQSMLDQAVIVAPIDGVILSVVATAGDDVSGPFITMADLSKRYLDISLDGADLGKIAIGYKVELVFDALPNQVFTGEVVQIDPNLYDASGIRISTQSAGQVTLIKALVAMDEIQTTAIDNLPIGMTAAVDIIGGQAQGVLFIPIEALREQSPGKYAVYVMENNEQKLRSVEVGLMDSNFAEIKNGLKLGDKVVISK